VGEKLPEWVKDRAELPVKHRARLLGNYRASITLLGRAARQQPCQKRAEEGAILSDYVSIPLRAIAMSKRKKVGIENTTD